MLWAGSALEGWYAAADPVLTMCPPCPRPAICFPKSRQPWITSHGLTSRTFLQCSTVWSRNETSGCDLRDP
jgi:hypothetical protein